MDGSGSNAAPADLKERVRYLDLRDTQVTKIGITSIKSELPNAHVVW
jgi:hypothetical protein